MSRAAEVLEQFCAAVNRNDIEAACVAFDSDIVRIEPAGFLTEAAYCGIPAVLEHLRFDRGTWAEGSCDLEGIFVNANRAVAYLYA